MNRFNLAVRLTASVLSVGLISCAKEEKSRDVFVARPPVIVGKGDLKTWDRFSDKSLDLQDTFEVSAHSLIVVSRCRRGQENFLETFAFTPRQQVRVFQMLPASVLAADLKKSKFDCGFELTFLNPSGSRHIYNIAPVALTDEDRALVKIERTGSPDSLRRIDIRKLENMRARWRSQGQAEFLCADVKTNALSFENVIELGAFDFANIEPLAGRPLEILQQHPLQSCRMIVRTQGQIDQISPRLLVQFPQTPLVLSIEKTGPPPAPQLRAFLKGAPLPVGFVTLTNPDKIGSRLVSFGKNRFPTTLEIFSLAPTPSQSLGSAKHVIKENFLAVDGEVVVPAGRTVRVALRLQPERASRFISEFIRMSGSLSLTEMDKSGEPLAEIQFSVPATDLSPDLYIFEAPVAEVPSPW